MPFTAGSGIQKTLGAPTASPRRVASRVSSIADIVAGPVRAPQAAPGPTLTEQVLTGPAIPAVEVDSPSAPRQPVLEPAAPAAVALEADEGASGPSEA